MRFKTFLAASLMLMGTTASVFGSNADAVPRPHADVPLANSVFVPVPQVDGIQEQPVLLAQSTQQLEEQIRLLNGKVEEMNFLVLQLQEQMRKMQEDNEFRFQELEKSKQGSVQPDDNGSDVAAAPAVTEAPSADVAAQQDAPADGTQVGEAPKELGTIKFDENGNPVAATVEDVIENTDVAAIPSGNSAEDVYRVAYDHVLAGEYAAAESGFRSHIEQFPQDKQTADARYWLGESLAGQGKHREAAEILLDAQRDYPKAKKAPDMLLKLGVSLAALDNRDVACATFAQVAKKYPKAGPTLMSRVAEEQAKTGC